MREYEKTHGKLTLTIAKTKEEALDYFMLAGEFQLHRWQDSGSINPFFTSFHISLIKNCIDQRTIELIKIDSGNIVIAVMYNFIVGRSVYFYLQGLKYENNPKMKPGLVAHSMISQYYLEEEMAIYDYMAGYSQYKVQMADRSEDLVSIRIQKPYNFYFWAESIVHRLKSYYQKRINQAK